MWGRLRWLWWPRAEARLLSRLSGLEQEYVLRFTAADSGARRPDNRQLYAAMAHAIGQRLKVQGNADNNASLVVSGVTSALFLENGGRIVYEARTDRQAAGLLEGATPECRGPTALLTHQRAQERLLLDAVVGAERTLHARGFAGDLGLVKNCRDQHGEIYGAQENYSMEVARGWRLWLYRAALVALLPTHALMTLWGVFCVLTVGAIVPLWVCAFLASEVLGEIPFLKRVPVVGTLTVRLERWATDFVETPMEDRFAPAQRTWATRAEQLLATVALVPSMWVYRKLCLAPLRDRGLAFLATRPVLTGTGAAIDGRFHLSERAASIVSVVRGTMRAEEKALLEPVGLTKVAAEMLWMRVRAYSRIYARVQRVTVAYSDGNRAEGAEFLKVGTMGLVLDMLEAGLLTDAPRLADPIAALKAVSADATLRARVATTDGRELSALEIQRYYLGAAKAFVCGAGVASAEALTVVALWERALDALETKPSAMVGTLDWPTKRMLISAGIEAGADEAAVMKLALKYHELGCGYFDQLKGPLRALTITREDEVRAAVTAPPTDTPAFVRSHLVRELSGGHEPVRVHWDRVEVGRLGSRRVIRLDDYRAARR